MAGGEVSKSELGPILMQAMSAAKTIRVQRDRLLRLHRLLRKATAGDAPADDGAPRIGKIVYGLVDIYFTGLGHGAHYLTLCLTMAAENGARFPLNIAFTTMPEEQLYDALLAQRLPARPTTQAEAFSRVEAAFFATHLPHQHHLRRCLEHLGVNLHLDTAAATPEPTQEDTVASATENLAKIGLSDPDAAVTEPPPQQASSKTALPAPADAAAGSMDQALSYLSDPAAAVTEPPPQQASSKTGLPVPADGTPGSMDQALSYLDRACTLVSLAVKHTDLAVTVLSRFLDPKEVAESKKMAEEWTFISKEENYPSE